MKRLKRIDRSLTFIVLLSGTVGASPYKSRIPSIFVRDNQQCLNPTYSPCEDPKLPRNLCCAPSTTCLSLEKSTSLICCPVGQDCSTINPVDCDACKAQSSVDPNQSNCSACNNQCCPGGFSCTNGQCVMKPNALTPLSSTTSSASSSSSAHTSTMTSTTTSTAPPTSTASNLPASSATMVPASQVESANPWPTNAIVVGLVCGIFAGILLCILGIFLYRQWQKRRSRRDSDKSFGNLTKAPGEMAMNSRSPYGGVQHFTPTNGGSAQLHDPALMKEHKYLAPAIVRRSTQTPALTGGSLGRSHLQPNVQPYNNARISHATTIDSDTTPTDAGTERIDVFADPITTHTSPYSSNPTPPHTGEFPKAFKTPPNLPAPIMTSPPRPMQEVHQPGGSPILRTMKTPPRPTPPQLAPPIELVADNQPRHIPTTPPSARYLHPPALRPNLPPVPMQRPYSHTTDGGRTTFGDFLSAGQSEQTPVMPSFQITNATGGLMVNKGQPQIRPGNPRKSSAAEILEANRRSRGGGQRRPILHTRTESEIRRAHDVRGSFNGDECIPPLRFDGNAMRGQRMVRGNGGRWRGK